MDGFSESLLSQNGKLCSSQDGITVKIAKKNTYDSELRGKWIIVQRSLLLTYLPFPNHCQAIP